MKECVHEKQQLRRCYREARRTLSSEEKRFIDCKISDNLLKSDLYRDAACIFCYVSTSDEIGTAAILEQALTDGKTLCVPLCGRAGEMSARRILSLDELKSGAYGIPEPSSGAPEIPPDEISLVIVPALSCDRNGYRLGYGKGFYDRYLSEFSGCTIGVVYSDYILPEVPRGRFDVSVDILLTEKGVRVTKDGKKTRPGKA